MTSPTPRPARQVPLLLYGALLALGGCALLALLALGVAGAAVLGSLGDGGWVFAVVRGAGLLVGAGLLLGLLDRVFLYPRRRETRPVAYDPPPNPRLTVVLTAWNDESSIGPAVGEFRAHPLVARVVVVDNASSDATARVAAECGAEVVVETRPGYGRCVHRALSEGAARTDTDLTLLCEGDRTFRAYDIEKFLAYVPHVEIVNGTRIVEQLRQRQTQLSAFIYYGNFFVGKLLEVKHLGRGTFTDVGTTYKLCRNEALRGLLPFLDPAVNLEFNAHFLDTALSRGLRIVECPITFHERVGVSKGGNVNNRRAFRVGMRMLWGILFSWRALRDPRG